MNKPPMSSSVARGVHFEYTSKLSAVYKLCGGVPEVYDVYDS